MTSEDEDDLDDEDYSPTKKSSKASEKDKKSSLSVTKPPNHKENHHKTKDKDKIHKIHKTASTTTPAPSNGLISAPPPTVANHVKSADSASSNGISLTTASPVKSAPPNGISESNKTGLTENSNHERVNASKLFPKSIAMPVKAVTTPTKTIPVTVPIPAETGSIPAPAVPAATPVPGASSFAKKIEVSTPKSGTFDVLGSIMKDMGK